MTESTDFQNGFLCGMATKGLIKTGVAYEPTVWNEEGIYNCFYIDFHRALAPFSEGMLDESIIVHDTVQIEIVGFDYVSSGVYRIYADLSGKTHGVTVLNKASTYLRFANGAKVTPFSAMFYVEGLNKYGKEYWIERLDDVNTALIMQNLDLSTLEETTVEVALYNTLEPIEILESIFDGQNLLTHGEIIETVSVTPFEA